MADRLRLDEGGLSAGRIGRRGVSTGDRRRLSGPCGRILARIQKERREGRHAFLDLPYDRALVDAARSYAGARRGTYRAVTVLGIGGSALGTTAVAAALRPAFADAKGIVPRLTVLDNVDPEWLSDYMASADLKRTLFCVVSKSGGTPETAAQFLWMRDRLCRKLGVRHRRQLLIVTDPEKGPLRAIARAEGYPSFPIPPAVGGRFSVLSAACLAPLALSGVDVRGLCRGAAAMERACRAPFARNPAARLAAALHLLSRKGVTNVVMMPYAQKLAPLADWYAQLLGESLGKKVNLAGKTVHSGLTPIRAVGATDQHSQLQLYAEGPQDKAILFLSVGRFGARLGIPRTGRPEFSYLSGRSFNDLMDAERLGTAQSLAEAGRPTATISFPRVTAETVGQFLLWMELKIVILGALMHVDPYDQPGVERGKVLAREILSRSK